MKYFFGLCIVILLSYWMVRPLLASGYFPMHDDTQVGRVVVMGKAIRWGQFPVRWVSDLGYGYGYPLFNFYGPLPYYVGGFFYALGFSGLTATKVMMGLGMILPGITMFLFTSSVMGIVPAIVSSVLFIYAPYHAVQLYVRGAIGELWTLVFIPLLAWGLIRSRRVLVASLGLSGMILSHTLLGYAVTVLLFIGCVVFWLIQLIRRKFDRSLFFAHCQIFVVGLGLSVFFWLPAISEMQFTNVVAQIGKTANFHDHFVCLSQLWSSAWGFGGSTAGCIDGMSFMIGKLHIIGGLYAVLAWIFGKHRNRVGVDIFIMASLATVAGVFFVLPWSYPIWEIIPGFIYLQYPWRFLVFAVFGLSILVGTIVWSIERKLVRIIISLVFIFGAYGLYAKWYTPQYLYTRPIAEFETPNELRFRVSNISDEYLPSDFIKPTSAYEYVRDTIGETDKITVATIVETDTYSRFGVTASEGVNIELKRVFFPGLTFWVNGKMQVPVVRNSLPTITVPSGESIIEMRFADTPVRMVANMVSMVSVLVLLYTYGKKINS